MTILWSNCLLWAWPRIFFFFLWEFKQKSWFLPRSNTGGLKRGSECAGNVGFVWLALGFADVQQYSWQCPSWQTWPGLFLTAIQLLGHRFVTASSKFVHDWHKEITGETQEFQTEAFVYDWKAYEIHGKNRNVFNEAFSVKKSKRNGTDLLEA